MKEVDTEVKTYLVNAVCPKCDKSILKNDIYGPVLMTHPPKWPHKCEDEDCGHVEHLTVKYPYTKFKEYPVCEVTLD